MKKVLTFVTVILVGLILMATAACGGKNGDGSVSGPNIVGKWTASAEDVSPYPGIQFVASLEFFKDGTYSLLVSGIGSDSGDYSFPDDTHIRFESPGFSETDTFSLSGDTMTVTKLGGSTMTLHRLR